MSETLKDLVDQVWQSSDGFSSAILITRRMSVDQRKSLKNVLLELMKSSDTESLDLPDDENIRNAFISSNSEEDELASILLLLMFAFHHSDGLLLLPLDLRKSRIHSWSEQTGLKEIVVQEALRLGPERLGGLL